MNQKNLAQNAAKEFSHRDNRLLFWYSFFMAFPTVILFQNISFFIFLALIYTLVKSGFSNFGFKKRIQIFALFFMLGAIASTINAYFFNGNEYLLRALQVLPNYLYWSFLIIFLVQHRNRLKFIPIFKGISFGLLLFLPYFFYFQYTPLFHGLAIFKSFGQNSFAFLLICFTPITIYYIQSRYGKKAAVLFIVIFSLAGFLSGSRSGSLLVFVGSTFTFVFTSRLTLGRAFSTIVIFLAFIAFFNTELGESIVKSLNPRTYDLVYNTRNTFDEDRSYLTRRALVDKGLYIFNKYPFAGVGLNNFGETEGQISGNFTGSKFVINKGLEEGKSAHNSYISILAEGGLLLSIPFLLILLTLIVFFFSSMRTMPDYYYPVFIAILMMAVHLYFISAILNVFGWFLIGLAAAMVYRAKETDVVVKRANDNLNIHIIESS